MVSYPFAKFQIDWVIVESAENTSHYPSVSLPYQFLKIWKKKNKKCVGKRCSFVQLETINKFPKIIKIQFWYFVSCFSKISQKIISENLARISLRYSFQGFPQKLLHAFSKKSVREFFQEIIPGFLHKCFQRLFQKIKSSKFLYKFFHGFPLQIFHRFFRNSSKVIIRNSFRDYSRNFPENFARNSLWDIFLNP